MTTSVPARGRSRRFRPTAVVLALAVLAALTLGGLRLWVVERVEVTSGSMRPTLHVGERLWVYKQGTPQRDGLVVFDGEALGQQGQLVKRVIGVSGDRVRCCDEQGRLVRNGQALEEPYLPPGTQASDVTFDVQVPKESLWVMGDDRPHSRDSRSRLGASGGGMVSLSSVTGTVLGRD